MKKDIETSRGQYHFETIGIIHSPFTDKFGIPRQPGLVTAARCRLELLPPYAREDAFTEIDGFSHAWLIFVFHACIDGGWRPTVRPPRLGGQRRVGVFASRAPFRPNPIGISAVRIEGLERSKGRLYLNLTGADLLDGTPVLDIKPYVPYADAIPDADGGFANEAPGTPIRVQFSEQAEQAIARFDPLGERQLRLLIEQLLQQDPRPGYMGRYPDRTDFGMCLYELNIRWRVGHGQSLVWDVTRSDKSGVPSLESGVRNP